MRNGRDGVGLLGVLVTCLLGAACGNSTGGSATEQVQRLELGQSVQVARNVEVTALAPGVWLHTSWYTYPGGARFPSNGLLVREGDQLLLIDTAWGEHLTEQLLDWVEVHLQMPVSKAIITHSHHDRIGGSAALERRGIQVLAHPLTRRFALEQGLPVPDTLEAIAGVGNVAVVGSVEVFFPGPGHTRDNIMVWLGEQEILFGGCAVRSASAQSLGNVAHADTVAWPQAIERALERYEAVKRVIPGHGPVGGRELLEHTRSLFAQ